MSMKLKSLAKMKDGLELLIEGSIEDAMDLAEASGEDPSVRKVLEYRIERIGEYLSDAETYNLPPDKQEALRTKYNILKAKVKKLK